MGRYRIWNIVIALILIGAIMAIHDTDMNQDSRSNPTPNVSDAHSVRASDGTTAITNKQDASSGAYVSTKDATVKVNDGDIDVIKLGLQSDGSYAFMFSDSTVPRLLMDADSMKISQSGVDVKTATNSQLIFNSSQNMFKIVATGTTTITGGSSASTNGSYSKIVAHNLGHTPIVMAYAVGYGSSLQPLPTVISASFRQHTITTPNDDFFMAVDQWARSGADGTNVTFSIDWANANYPTAYVVSDLVIKYYLLQETAN